MISLATGFDLEAYRWQWQRMAAVLGTTTDARSLSCHQV